MSLRTVISRSIAVAWAATIAVAFIVSLLFYVIAEFRGNAAIDWQNLAMAGVAAFVSACMSAYVSLGIALVVGIPIFYVWRRFGLTSVTAYLFAGALLSMFTLALLYAAYQFKIFLYGQPLLVRIAVTIALVSGPVAALTVRKIDRPGEVRSTDSETT